MKRLSEIEDILRSHKTSLFNKYGLKSIAIFGSYGRSEQIDESDVDILVEFNQPIGLEFIDLAEELEKILNQKVDLVSKNGIKSKYLASINNELIYV